MRYLVAQTRNEPYYPGFRDLNLYVVAIYLIAFLYGIALATIAYRVRSTKARLHEIEGLLANSSEPGHLIQLEQDKLKLQRDYDTLTSTAPGRWFR